MTALRATATACSNIAFVKYWGKTDADCNLPMNGSLSMTLSDATTTTTVEWDPQLKTDEVYLDGERVLDRRADRVSRFLDRLREAWYRMGARVASQNSFPAGTGIASSASGFAALAAAGIAAFGEGLPDETELSRWARRGSGSACRSVFGGFVEWVPGDDDSSVARPLCGPDYWDLRDLVVVVSRTPKLIGSSDGHRIAARHPFMPVRQSLLRDRLVAVKGALAARDIASFGALVEHEALEMHAIMLSGEPSALYLQPETVRLMHLVRAWRDDGGVPVWFTLDAGPNMHVLCEADAAPQVRGLIADALPGARVLENRPGAGVRLHHHHLL